MISAGVTTNNDPRRIMTGGSLFYVEKWPPVIILRRKMTPSRRIMSPTRRINTRGVFIQRVGYRKMTPIEKWPPYIIVEPAKQSATWGSLSRRLSVRLSHFWFAYNCFILRDRTFTFCMCVPYDKTFPMVPYILSKWLDHDLWPTFGKL